MGKGDVMGSPRPGTRRFIGPLTPAQKRRRDRARANFHLANALSDARNMSVGDAFKLLATGYGRYAGRGYGCE